MGHLRHNEARIEYRFNNEEVSFLQNSLPTRDLGFEALEDRL